MEVSEDPNETSIENWTTGEVSLWISKHFNAETADKFKGTFYTKCKSGAHPTVLKQNFMNKNTFPTFSIYN